MSKPESTHYSLFEVRLQGPLDGHRHEWIGGRLELYAESAQAACIRVSALAEALRGSGIHLGPPVQVRFV
jgi:hypothetical protein